MTFTDPSVAAARYSRMWVLIYMISAMTFASISVAIFTVVTRGDDRELILARLAEQQEQDTSSQISARNANACTGYQNHRAIEEAVRDLGRLNGVVLDSPRVLPSKETIRACKDVNIEIDEQGIPQISNVGSNARTPAVPE
ncbi:MAG: hypothetical protein H7247_05700 [Polaromonas sp.]|nr:hypothetical protein [Gemmatimonadaceae bacterium]